MEDFGGVVPGTVKELLTLPGVGEYTAGAIASIAFEQPVPLVDGNVVRVFSRLGKVALEAKDRNLNKACWQFGKLLVDEERPGDFNQALMELGAVTCTPKNPKCASCPLRELCVVQKLSPAETVNYPVKAKKKVIPEKTYRVSMISRDVHDGLVQYLTIKRPNKGLLAGQYEFVSLETDNENLGKKRKRNGCNPSRVDKFLQDAGLCNACTADRNDSKELGRFTHTFSHVRYICEVESFKLSNSSPDCTVCKLCDTAQWLTEEELTSKGKTKLLSKCLDLENKGPSKSRSNAVEKGQTLLTKHFCRGKTV